MSNQQPPITTTDAGSPVASDEYSLTVGPGGPVWLQDAYLNEKLAHFVRERIPDRVYHVKGGGAFGAGQSDESGLGDSGAPENSIHRRPHRRGRPWIRRPARRCWRISQRCAIPGRRRKY